VPHLATGLIRLEQSPLEPKQEHRGIKVKPAFAVVWILSIALAVGLTRYISPAGGGSEDRPSFDAVFSERDPLQRAYLISSSLQSLSEADLPELLRALSDQRMGIESEEVRLVMLSWASFDPAGAYEWAQQGPKNWRPALVDQAVYAWSYYDAPAVLALVEAVEGEDSKLRMRQNMIDGWMRGPDKLGAVEYIGNFPDMKRRGRLFFLFAGEIMMAEGSDGAMEWVVALPDDSPNQIKLGLFHHVANMIASEDAERAAQWYLANRTLWFSEGALDGIARRWVQHHDRPSAIEFFMAMDSDGLRAEARSGAIASAFRSWMQIDPDGAQAWLLPQLPNPMLDIATKETLKRLLPTDPDKSMDWASRLQDADERRTQLIRVGKRWREKDPEAVDAWMAEHEVPEDIRKKILTAPAKKQQGMQMRPKPAAAGKP
jgi:hypothetical protein